MKALGAALEQGWRTWAGLQPRERRLLALGGGVIGLALVYTLAFEPAWQGRLKRSAELPVLREQLAQIEGLAVEARALTAAVRPPSAQPVGELSSAQVRAELERSLQVAGWGAQAATVEPAGTQWRVRLKDVTVQEWLRWQETVQTEARLRATEVIVERDRAPGRVSVRVSFERPERAS